MTRNGSLEERLESLGTLLRARPRLTDRVMDAVRASAADMTVELPADAPVAARHHRWLLAASFAAIATIAAAVFVATTLFSSQSIGLAEVARALQSQKWIHGSAPPGSMWLAPQREIWAFKLPGAFDFYDGREKVKYEYRPGDNAITKLPLGEENAERVLPIKALADGSIALGPWIMGTEKVVSQRRREVTEGGKTWIEFQMVLWRGDQNEVILRVDPATRLPVSLSSASSKGAVAPQPWLFDYPEDGPADIYALGVPRDLKIDDRVPSGPALRTLEGMATSRASIGDFRLIVDCPPSGSVVYRKGAKWRIDLWRSSVPLPQRPEKPDSGKWFDELVQQRQCVQLLVCDGNAVWRNTAHLAGGPPEWELSRHPAPQDLMSGEGVGMISLAPRANFASLLFPDLSPKYGWGLDFDSDPPDAPGCVLLKRSAQITIPNTTGHEWYYVDPAKGYAVVRIKSFNVRTDVPAAPRSPLAPPIALEAPESAQTITLEEFQQSPQGFWYAGAVRGFLPARYQFDFAGEMPDSLFEVNDPQPSRQ